MRRDVFFFSCSIIECVHALLPRIQASLPPAFSVIASNFFFFNTIFSHFRNLHTHVAASLPDKSWRSGRSRSCLGALRSWRICKSCCTSPRRWRSGWLRLSTTCSIRYHPANICGTWHKILSYPKSNRQPDHPLLLVLVPVFPVRRAAERRRKKRPPGLLLLLLQPPCRPSLTVSMR